MHTVHGFACCRLLICNQRLTYIEIVCADVTNVQDPDLHAGVTTHTPADADAAQADVQDPGEVAGSDAGAAVFSGVSMVMHECIMV
jgi:hypothetical protein